MATQFDPIAKDESLNTTEVTPRNIADVLAEELSGIASALTPAQLNSLADVTISLPSDGQTLKYNSVTQKWENANDAGGHTIENPSGTDLTQRANLQFVDAHITDNALDNKTEVEIAKEVTEADFDTLNPQGTEYDGVYLMEVADATPLTADMVGYGDGTVKSYLDGLVKSIDITTPSSGNTMTLTLPTGFTTSNCIVLNIRRTGTEDYFVQNADTTVYYAGTVAMLYYVDNMRSRAMTIYFMRIA